MMFKKNFLCSHIYKLDFAIAHRVHTHSNRIIFIAILQ